MAACLRFAELTITYPGQLDGRNTAGTGSLFYLVRSARSAALELASACKALPDFYTLQIARFPFVQPPQRWEREQAFEKEVEGPKELAFNYLKSNTGCKGRGPPYC